MELTSVKMQQVVFGKDFENFWYTPLLRFGKGKKALRQVPIYIKESNTKKIDDCYADFMQFKGKSIDSIIDKHDELVSKYNEYNYRQEKKEKSLIE